MLTPVPTTTTYAGWPAPLPRRGRPDRRARQRRARRGSADLAVAVVGEQHVVGPLEARVELVTGRSRHLAQRPRTARGPRAAAASRRPRGPLTGIAHDTATDARSGTSHTRPRRPRPPVWWSVSTTHQRPPAAAPGPRHTGPVGRAAAVTRSRSRLFVEPMAAWNSTPRHGWPDVTKPAPTISASSESRTSPRLECGHGTRSGTCRRRPDGRSHRSRPHDHGGQARRSQAARGRGGQRRVGAGRREAARARQEDSPRAHRDAARRGQLHRDGQVRPAPQQPVRPGGQPALRRRRRHRLRHDRRPPGRRSSRRTSPSSAARSARSSARRSSRSWTSR